MIFLKPEDHKPSSPLIGKAESLSVADWLMIPGPFHYAKPEASVPGSRIS